jgi:hypothetical protein
MVLRTQSKIHSLASFFGYVSRRYIIARARLQFCIYYSNGMQTEGIFYHVPAHAALTQRLSHTPSSGLLMEIRTLNGTRYSTVTVA